MERLSELAAKPASADPYAEMDSIQKSNLIVFLQEMLRERDSHINLLTGKLDDIQQSLNEALKLLKSPNDLCTPKGIRTAETGGQLSVHFLGSALCLPQGWQLFNTKNSKKSLIFMPKIFDDRPQTAVRMGLHTFWTLTYRICRKKRYLCSENMWHATKR